MQERGPFFNLFNIFPSSTKTENSPYCHQVTTFLFTYNSKTCVKRPLSKYQNWFPRPIIAECRSKVLQNAPRGAICKYFRPSISYHLSLRSFFCPFLSGRFTQVYCICYSVGSDLFTFKHTESKRTCLWLRL